MSDEELEASLDRWLDSGGDRQALMTVDEVRAVQLLVGILGMGEGVGANAAREMEARLERRLAAH